MKRQPRHCFRRIPLAWSTVTLCWLAAVCFGGQAENDLTRHYRAAGPYEVKAMDAAWTDPARRRDVPARIYHPETGKGPFPVIVFSHGLGASNEHYEYLGRHWASHGYVSVHPAHKGTDLETFQRSRNPIADVARSISAKAAIDRVLDVRFVIDRLEQVQGEPGPLGGRLDLKRIGMAGHSYGALTTLLLAGQGYMLNGQWHSTPEPRIKAAIELSAPLISRRDQHAQAFEPVAIPMLHVTGTRDQIFFSPPADRRVPFEFGKAADQYLLVIEGADHITFVGITRRQDAAHIPLIRMSSIAFWDACLKGDARARRWLAGGTFRQFLGQQGELLVRDVPPDVAPAASR